MFEKFKKILNGNDMNKYKDFTIKYIDEDTSERKILEIGTDKDKKYMFDFIKDFNSNKEINYVKEINNVLYKLIGYKINLKNKEILILLSSASVNNEDRETINNFKINKILIDLPINYIKLMEEFSKSEFKKNLDTVNKVDENLKKETEKTKEDMKKYINIHSTHCDIADSFAEITEYLKGNGVFNNNKVVSKCPEYYKLHIDKYDIDITVNDIIEALDKSFKDNKIYCGRVEFNYYSNAIEYLLRAYRKCNKIDDLRKAISEINFIINK